MNETRFKITRILIEGVLHKYSTRAHNYVSLRSILGDYSNNITRRAIREAMFDKLTILEMVKNKNGSSKVKSKTMWVLKIYKDFDPKNAKHDYLTFMTYRTLEEAERLTELMRRIHGWSDRKPRDSESYDSFHVNEDTVNESFVTFKAKYNYMVKKYSYTNGQAAHDKLMELIYDYGTDMVKYTEDVITKSFIKERKELKKRYKEKIAKVKKLFDEISEKLKNLDDEFIWE